MACGGCNNKKAHVQINLPAPPDQVLSGGAIKLRQVPKEIPEGYEADPGDPTLLRPIWPPCIYRLSQPHLKRGGMSVFSVCGCQKHPKRGQKITMDDCSTCTVKVEPDKDKDA